MTILGRENVIHTGATYLLIERTNIVWGQLNYLSSSCKHFFKKN